MNNFLSYLKECVDVFKKNVSNEPVRILGHLDSDGISSSSILIKAFHREGIKVVYSSHRQADEKVVKELGREPYKIYFFVDFGSNVLKFINEYLNGKKVFILDHHKFEYIKTEHYNINQNKFNIDDNCVSGAGIAYLFARCLNPRNKDLSYLALIGAIGDNQDKNGFSEINKLIVNDAIEFGDVDIKLGLSFFGAQSRPLHKLISSSTDIFIPGITGNEVGAKKFLEDLGIDVMDNKGQYRKAFDLNKEEMNKLITAIMISKIESKDKPEDIIGNIYTLKKEENGETVKDLKEFSTLLNACGRLNMASLGVGTCLGDKNFKLKAYELLKNYKNEIINSMNWVYSNRNTENIIEKDKLVIINAKNNVKDTMIGTVNSILCKSGIFNDGCLVVSMAYTLDNNIKISLRSINSELDLSSLINELCIKLNGVGGGHPNAAGGLIPTAKEQEFISEILNRFNLKEISN